MISNEGSEGIALVMLIINAIALRRAKQPIWEGGVFSG
jgi:hypothetical protein